MKYASFSYTDSKNVTKQRSVLILQEPMKFVTGYDVSEVSDENVARMAVELGRAIDNFKAEQARIAAEFDCATAYRQFVPERMDYITTEYI